LNRWPDTGLESVVGFNYAVLFSASDGVAEAAALQGCEGVGAGAGNCSVESLKAATQYYFWLTLSHSSYAALTSANSCDVTTARESYSGLTSHVPTGSSLVLVLAEPPMPSPVRVAIELKEGTEPDASIAGECVVDMWVSGANCTTESLKPLTAYYAVVKAEKPRYVTVQATIGPMYTTPSLHSADFSRREASSLMGVAEGLIDILLWDVLCGACACSHPRAACTTCHRSLHRCRIQPIVQHSLKALRQRRCQYEQQTAMQRVPYDQYFCGLRSWHDDAA